MNDSYKIQPKMTISSGYSLDNLQLTYVLHDGVGLPAQKLPRFTRYICIKSGPHTIFTVSETVPVVIGV